MNKTQKGRLFSTIKCAGLALPLIFGSTNIVYATNNSTTIVSETQNKIIGVKQINPTTVELIFENNDRISFDFYGDNIFRLFQDTKGGIIRDPEAQPEAQILVNQPRTEIKKLNINEFGDEITVTTNSIKLSIDKNTSLMKAIRLSDNAVVFEQVKPIQYNKKNTSIAFKEFADEYFYGGGVQNGRFSHKGKKISIENQNSWTDGGVASPTPFYWSTKGYGVMWYTFKKGEYNFGAKESGVVNLHHDTDYFDVFFMINDGGISLLNDFYQLTGNPVLIPKFGFYQGHLNAYNRDFWKENNEGKGILFEDGKRYTESQKGDKGGIKESLNGEKDNYQFSARAVIDRYKSHDMPLGWLLPNDGYGAGYGQTETLDGNIANLKSLADYAHKQGVEIGLWTQSDLHPKEDVSALLQRDIVKEVRDAGVRVLKTDVAWVGAGYSFGLNGIADVANIMTYYGGNSRPFIISLDGWAGTQRYAGVWSGDQSGGVWEYIRFHIPTYIGSGLSGQPNISSDMDGIFGGKNGVVNTRDFQWKTFTPTQLNMDGWGANEKYPHALGEPYTSINRLYLKFKSEMMPYAYSIAKEAVDGKPMVRAMFLENANPYTLGKSTQYQFFYGPNFIVAPIYKETKVDKKGNDIRNGIYLPQGKWVDYFSGEVYEGNCIINNFDAPLWKLPVFVKAGAIIPLTNPNNNVSEINNQHRIYEIYPEGNSQFTEYDDDGISELYRLKQGTYTLIESKLDEKQNLNIRVAKTKGDFQGFVRSKSTEFRINTTNLPKKITAKIGSKKVKLTQANSLADFDRGSNVFYYNDKVNLNRFATANSDFEKVEIKKNPVLYIKLASTDITTNEVSVEVKEFAYNMGNSSLHKTGEIVAPKMNLTANLAEAYTLNPTWEAVANADYYEIEFNNMCYTTIKDSELLFEDLTPETNYQFKIRSVNKDGHSDWDSFEMTTKSNPLEFAIQNVKATNSTKDQGGYGINKLFDFDESNLWHTSWDGKATPFDIVVDLQTINQLDKIHYLVRDGAGNGTLLEGCISSSFDKQNWTKSVDFKWEKNTDTKVFEFADKPTARYVRITVTNAVGDFGSGKELYIFKVPNTESYIPGDINNDRLVDRNDLTSYTNYTGLRWGDADFEGYISKGDLNRNNLIDAYDISVVGTRLDGGIDEYSKDVLSGKIELKSDKINLKSGEVFEVTVWGKGMKAINAMSFALPYDQTKMEFMSIRPINMKEMDNLTNDRLHTNGQKSLYPTFVNIGQKETLSGDLELFKITFKAKQDMKFDLKLIDGFLVDQKLNVITF